MNKLAPKGLQYPRKWWALGLVVCLLVGFLGSAYIVGVLLHRQPVTLNGNPTIQSQVPTPDLLTQVEAKYGPWKIADSESAGEHTHIVLLFANGSKQVGKALQPHTVWQPAVATDVRYATVQGSAVVIQDIRNNRIVLGVNQIFIFGDQPQLMYRFTPAGSLVATATLK